MARKSFNITLNEAQIDLMMQLKPLYGERRAEIAGQLIILMLEQKIKEGLIDPSKLAPTSDDED